MSKLESTKKMIRAVLLSCKEGVLSHRLQADYKSLTGSGIPFKKLGYNSIHDFVRNIPDVVRVTQRQGEVVYHAVADESTQHILKMVSHQRSAKKKKPKSRSYKSYKTNQPFHYPMRHHNRSVKVPMPSYGVKKSISDTSAIAMQKRFHAKQRISMTNKSIIPTQNQSIRNSNPLSLRSQNQQVAPRFWKSQTLGGQMDKSRQVDINSVIKNRIKTLLGSNPSGVFSNNLSKLYFDEYKCKLPDHVVYTLESGAVSDVAKVEKLTSGIREKIILYPINTPSPMKKTMRQMVAEKKPVYTHIPEKTKVVESNSSKRKDEQLQSSKALEWKSEKIKISSQTEGMSLKISDMSKNQIRLILKKFPNGISSFELEANYYQIYGKELPDVLLKGLECGLISDVASIEKLTKGNREKIVFYPLQLESKTVRQDQSARTSTRFKDTTNKINEEEYIISDIVKKRIKRILSISHHGMQSSTLSTVYLETFKEPLDSKIISTMENGFFNEVVEIQREGGKTLLSLRRKDQKSTGPKYPAISSKSVCKIPESSPLKIGSEYEGTIQHIIDCETFFVQISTFSDIGKAIEDCTKYIRYGTISSLTPGLEVISRNKFDKRRSRIVRDIGSEAEVYNLDVGDTHYIQRCDLALMPDELQSIPELALLMSLQRPDDSGNWSERASSKFQQLFLGKKVSIKVTSAQKKKLNDKKKVCYTAICSLGRFNINDRLMCEEQDWSNFRKVEVTSDQSQSTAYLSDDSNDDVEGDTSYETIDSDYSDDVESPQRIVTLNKDADKKVSKITLVSKGRYLKTQNIKSANAKKMVRTVKLSDDKMPHEQKIKITLTNMKKTSDKTPAYHNKQEVLDRKVELVRPSFSIKSELADYDLSRVKVSDRKGNLPSMNKPELSYESVSSNSSLSSLPVYQNHVQSADNNITMLPNSSLKHSLVSQRLVEHPVTIQRTVVVPPSVKVPAGPFVSSIFPAPLLPQHHPHHSIVERQSSGPSVSSIDSELQSVDAELIDKVISDMEKRLQSPIYMSPPSSLPVNIREYGRLARIMITKVQSPGLFYMIPLEKLPILKSLTNQMNEYFSLPESVIKIPDSPVKDSIYAAFCDVAGLLGWYRVMICKPIHAVHKLASVRLVDVGIRDCVPVSKLSILPPQFSRPTPCAMCARLAGIKPKDLSSIFIEQATKAFEDWISGKNLVAHIVKRSFSNQHPVYDVCLFDGNEESDGKWINDLMVDEWNVADYITETSLQDEVLVH